MGNVGVHRSLTIGRICSAPTTARAASVGAPDASRESVDGFDCANTGAGAIASATPTIREPQRLAQMTHGIFSLASMSGRMVVGMFPPSANHSLQLCSRKPSCS
jgi:hypothetical protein